jgi:hypothetical protein
LLYCFQRVDFVVFAENAECDGDQVSAVVTAGRLETVVVPEQKAPPRAWLSFERASVYRQKDGIVVFN